MTSFLLVFRRARRTVLGHRRLLAALCAAIAVAAGIRATTAPPPSTSAVLTAARDLPSGTVIRRDDVRVARFTPGSVPAGTLGLDELVGRTTAAPMRAGEALTDVRLVRDSLLNGYPGRVLAPVRIADADAVGLLRVGDRIDLLAADPESHQATVLAEAVPVVAIPEPVDDSGTAVSPGGVGALVVVAVHDSTAARLAQSAVTSLVSLVVTR